MALSTTRAAAQQAIAKTIGVLLYPGFELLDVTGPLEMLGSTVLAEHAKDTLGASLSFTYISTDDAPGPVASAQGGARLVADCTLGTAPAALDVLLVPGGPGARREVGNAALLGFLRDRAAPGERKPPEPGRRGRPLRSCRWARRGALGRVGARRDAARRGAARRVSFNNLFSLGVWRGWECGGAGSVEVERHASCRLACAKAPAYQSSIKHFGISLM